MAKQAFCEKKVTAVVEDGHVRLPAGIGLPDGQLVQVTWQEGDIPSNAYDRDPLQDSDVHKDFLWAMTRDPPK